MSIYKLKLSIKVSGPANIPFLNQNQYTSTVCDRFQYYTYMNHLNNLNKF